jgi:hypothetical protein
LSPHPCSPYSRSRNPRKLQFTALNSINQETSKNFRNFSSRDHGRARWKRPEDPIRSDLQCCAATREPQDLQRPLKLPKDLQSKSSGLAHLEDDDDDDRSCLSEPESWIISIKKLLNPGARINNTLRTSKLDHDHCQELGIELGDVQSKRFKDLKFLLLRSGFSHPKLSNCN